MGFTEKRKAVTKFYIGENVRFMFKTDWSSKWVYGTVRFSGFGLNIKQTFPSIANLPMYKNIDPNGWYNVVYGYDKLYYIVADKDLEKEG
jgi:hypothetical protein